MTRLSRIIAVPYAAVKICRFGLHRAQYAADSFTLLGAVGYFMCLLFPSELSHSAFIPLNSHAASYYNFCCCISYEIISDHCRPYFSSRSHRIVVVCRVQRFGAISGFSESSCIPRASRIVARPRLCRTVHGWDPGPEIGFGPVAMQSPGCKYGRG